MSLPTTVSIRPMHRPVKKLVLPANRRKHMLTLTVQGEHLFREIMEANHRISEILLKDLSREEISIFSSVIRKMDQNSDLLMK